MYLFFLRGALEDNGPLASAVLSNVAPAKRPAKCSAKCPAMRLSSTRQAPAMRPPIARQTNAKRPPGARHLSSRPEHVKRSPSSPSSRRALARTKRTPKPSRRMRSSRSVAHIANALPLHANGKPLPIPADLAPRASQANHALPANDELANSSRPTHKAKQSHVAAKQSARKAPTWCPPSA